MKNLKKFFTLLIFSCIVILFVSGCDDGCDHCNESYSRWYHFLVNNTDKILYYEAYYEDDSDEDILSFDTTLLPNDTLFLYSYKFTPPGASIDDPTRFYWLSSKVVIKDDEQIILFYRSSKTENCGETDFVLEKTTKDKGYSYWTIDPDYISKKSCNMSWEDLERDYLGNE
ncbi:MAG: hypothetical protein FWF51_00835 [Chitinivibrionia bacterium]|nr:hypothetical protein [Chitinivibrionia bacterium]